MRRTAALPRETGSNAGPTQQSHSRAHAPCTGSPYTPFGTTNTEVHKRKRRTPDQMLQSTGDVVRRRQCTNRTRQSSALTNTTPPLVNGTGNSPSPGRPTPGVVKQDKSSGGSVDTTKTRSGPQRVRMSSGQRPIGAAKANNQIPRPCAPPPPPLVQSSKKRSKHECSSDTPSGAQSIRYLNPVPHQLGPKKLQFRRKCSVDKAFVGQGGGGTYRRREAEPTRD